MATISVTAPFARAGVYPRTGKQIGADFDPDALYQLFIPAEVLEAITETAVPLIDSSHDKTTYPDFDPGCVLGLVRDIRYRDGALSGGLVIWNPATIDAIRANAGARQLSISVVDAEYEQRDGEFDEKPFDIVMTACRLDSVALVEEGAMGTDCALPAWPIS